jgi:hypothetical protein
MNFATEDGKYSMGFPVDQSLKPTSYVRADKKGELVFVGFVDHDLKIAFAFVVEKLHSPAARIVHLKPQPITL